MLCVCVCLCVGFLLDSLFHLNPILWDGTALSWGLSPQLILSGRFQTSPEGCFKTLLRASETRQVPVKGPVPQQSAELLSGSLVSLFLFESTLEYAEQVTQVPTPVWKMESGKLEERGPSFPVGTDRRGRSQKMGAEGMV